MFDVTTAKIKLNIQDDTQDGDIAAVIRASISILETYCNRKLAYDEDISHFYHFQGSTIQLPRFPVEAVSELKPALSYHVHYRTGIILFHRPIVQDTIEVHYSGGYRTFPVELEQVLWSLFDHIWNLGTHVQQTSANNIESITLADVGTIRFAKDAITNAARDGINGILDVYRDILDAYRLYVV